MNPGVAMLAALINPALFWGGLGAVSVPIVIHLLARRRFRRVRWAAMAFLLDAEKRNRKRVRVEELLLLLLRCLAVFLLGLLASRPFVEPKGIAALIGGSDRTERIFLIDDSFSMGYAGGGDTVLEKAKTSVSNLVQRLRIHAPDDTVTVLRTSQLDTPLVTGAVLDDEQVELLLSRVTAMDPSQQALNVSASLDAVRAVLDNDPGIISAVLYVVSDFQRKDWVTTGQGTGGNTMLAGAIEAWTNADHAARMVLIDVGEDDARNRAITELDPVQRQLVTGVSANIAVAIANYTPEEKDALELDVAIAQRPAASMPVQNIAPRSITRAMLPVLFDRTGEQVVRVALPGDDLQVDDVRELVAEINDAVRVLVVNGEPSTDAYLDETALLVTALRPEGEVFSGNQVDVIDESQLDGARFSDYHLVILANLYRVSEPISDALHRYVANGGGLLIFLGDQVSDPALLNATLYREGAGLLPASLQAVVRAGDTGVTLADSDSRHPVAQVFSGPENPFRSRVRFHQYFQLDPPETKEPTSEDEEADVPHRAPAEVIARFDDGDQSPAIVERPFGDGRVMLFASSCDLEWNDWGRDASFVVTVQEMVQHLARASSKGDTVRVGEPIVMPLDPGRFEATASVRDPNYPQSEEASITAAAIDARGMALRWEDTRKSGVYTFVLQARTGETVLQRAVVTLDPLESDLAAADESEIKAAFGSLPVDYVAGVAARDDAADEGRREVWPGILVMALSILLIEQFLAWRFGRR